MKGKLTHNLTALSSAAVLAVYGAGYLRTKAAAEKFADDSVPRRAPEFESGIGRMGGPAPQDASAAPAAPPAPKYKDGAYKGWGTSRHGDIEATVTVANGRIESAIISQCLTRYSCSWISPLPPQVAARQSPEVDFVSGSTQSTYAIYYAVIEALKLAK